MHHSNANIWKREFFWFSGRERYIRIIPALEYCFVWDPRMNFDSVESWMFLIPLPFCSPFVPLLTLSSGKKSFSSFQVGYIGQGDWFFSTLRGFACKWCPLRERSPKTAEFSPGFLQGSFESSQISFSISIHCRFFSVFARVVLHDFLCKVL